MTPASTEAMEVPRDERRVGRLRLVFEPGARGTWLSESAAVAPIRMHRAFRSPSGDAIVQLVHVGPGLLAGDEIEIDVVVRGGASAILLPQSATKVHRMRAGEAARQTLHVRVEAGGRAEIHGGLVIPFPAAELHQRTSVDVADGGTFLGTERWATGRHGAAERSAFRRLSSRLRVRYAGAMRYADALELEGRGAPEGGRRRSPSRALDGREAFASGIVVGAAPPEPLAEADRAVGHFDAQGAYLRALADDPGELREAVFAFGEAARRAAGLDPLDYARFGV